MRAAVRRWQSRGQDQLREAEAVNLQRPVRQDDATCCHDHPGDEGPHGEGRVGRACWGGEHHATALVLERERVLRRGDDDASVERLGRVLRGDGHEIRGPAGRDTRPAIWGVRAVATCDGAGVASMLPGPAGRPRARRGGRLTAPANSSTTEGREGMSLNTVPTTTRSCPTRSRTICGRRWRDGKWTRQQAVARAMEGAMAARTQSPSEAGGGALNLS